MQGPGPLQHSLLHLDCPACGAVAAEQLADGGGVHLLFREAWRHWLDGRRGIADGTRESYRQYFQQLEVFFGEMRLGEISSRHVARYQDRRRAEIQALRRRRGWALAATDGASRINHEISALAQLLGRMGLWASLERCYEPLRLPRESPGVALTEEEERHLFQVARSKPRWLVAYCCHLISVGTTAGPGEIRHLRVRDLDLAAGTIYVQGGAKNSFRLRSLPVEGDAAWAARRLLERYQQAMVKAGIAPNPEHFLLYHRAHRAGAPPDPMRPMGSWKRAHYSLRAQAGKKFPRLLHLRRYDLRHTAGTKMLEDPEISYSTIERMMGHRLGSRTKQRYDHVRDATMRSAAASLDGGHTRAITFPEARPGLRKPPKGALSQLSKLLRRIAVGNEGDPSGGAEPSE